MVEEKFVFTDSAKRNIFITIGAGLILLVIGLFFVDKFSGHESHADKSHDSEYVKSSDSAGSADAATVATPEGHGHGEKAVWLKRLIKNLWHSNVFFTGIALIGVFFVAFNYVAWSGWSVVIKRIPESFGSFLPVVGVLLLATFLGFKSDLFHWTYLPLFDKSSPEYDVIIAGKEGYLNFTFYVIRLVVYFISWYVCWYFLRKYSIQEDITGDIKWYNKSVYLSAGFLVIFGITSSMAAWDWIMSIDAHFFSTMFGWYVFASWFVTGLAVITLFVVYLKEAGYLQAVNENHIHDLGKYMFAFSIFWAYIWFSQFLLIYYANIPEEAVYFVERLQNDAYSPFFFFNLIINFLVPFLLLMTRDAKRQLMIVKVVAFFIIIGHWSDFYLMITPAILGENGGFDFWFFFVELGMFLVYAGLFLLVTLTALGRTPLIAKNDPMLEESVHHHVY
jgi:hypothetical protein